MSDELTYIMAAIARSAGALAEIAGGMDDATTGYEALLIAIRDLSEQATTLEAAGAEDPIDVGRLAACAVIVLQVVGRACKAADSGAILATDRLDFN